jgi:transcriptional regulator of acetoin/glycerol metabolism
MVDLHSAFEKHAYKVHKEIAVTSPAHSVIAASWRRSMLHHGITPSEKNLARRLSGRELLLAKQKLEFLLHLAKPIMEELFLTVGQTGCCVVLTDKDGVILHRLTNDVDEASFNAWGLNAGSIWSEDRQGTNGIGTCAIEKRAILIHKDQHYRSKNIGMTCMGAPIFDTDGAIMAVLDVSSARNDLQKEFAQVLTSLVSNTANRIETEHFRASFNEAQIVVAEGYCALGTPLLASDRDDLIIGANRAARKMLNLQRETFAIPIPHDDLITGSTRSTGLQSAERAALRKAISRTKGNMTLAAKELDVSRATFYRMLKKHGISS